MKKLFIILIYFLMIVISACKKQATTTNIKNPIVVIKTKPKLSVVKASQITNTTAKIGGIIIDNGNDSIIEWGVHVIGTINGEQKDWIFNAQANTTSFNMNLEKLKLGSKYIVYAYAYNSTGIGFSISDTFFTDSSYILYKIGDVTLTGGIVFYDKGLFTDGWRFLEVSPNEISRTTWWSCSSEIINGLKDELGGGKFNTDTILSICKGLSGAVVNSRNFHGDSYLPTKTELQYIYQNLYKKNIGNISVGTYWTSNTIGGSSYGANLSASNLTFDYFPRNNNWLIVRGVRRF